MLREAATSMSHIGTHSRQLVQVRNYNQRGDSDADVDSCESSVYLMARGDGGDPACWLDQACDACGSLVEKGRVLISDREDSEITNVIRSGSN